jgi:hypothetical protein
MGCGLVVEGMLMFEGGWRAWLWRILWLYDTRFPWLCSELLLPVRDGMECERISIYHTLRLCTNEAFLNST